MQTEVKVNLICKAIRDNKKSKMYLKMRTPILGKFVCLDDFEEKLRKGWFRFVSEGNMELWNLSKSEFLTRLFKVEDIVDIKEYENVD